MSTIKNSASTQPTDTSALSRDAARKINCPTCQKIVPWVEEEKFRPFCCQKCQLIDFGEWATEKHSIPSNEPMEDFNLDAQDQ